MRQLSRTDIFLDFILHLETRNLRRNKLIEWMIFGVSDMEQFATADVVGYAEKAAGEKCATMNCS